ncbi:MULTISPECIES: hypothetical protein [Burkholderia]|uniref:hypothetical protein n=1 Tax=Burkholderia TaxID=32008 RepID=UPI000BF92FDC|nr:hypothetical protein [Burkholderia sp. JKS000303]PFH12849.1 hypothetical protein BX604_7269 [Burkholderia sp. JKS000303]
MALTTNTQANADSIVNHATGVVVTDSATAAALTITCGFKPRIIRWVNVTSSGALTKDEWYDGMAANNSVHTVGSTGVVTLSTTAGPSVGAPATGNDGTFTMPAASVPASSSFVWEAIG